VFKFTCQLEDIDYNCGLVVSGILIVLNLKNLMSEDTAAIIKCTEIRASLASRDGNEVYFHFSNWVKTLLPFWLQAIDQIAEDTHFYQEKASKHAEVAKSAFALMDGWRSGQVKLVKARRSEIDSAISYIRNGAALSAVSDIAFAPVCRNAASALRACLGLASGSYADAQLPGVVAQQIYAIAAVKTLFPVEDSDLIGYLPRTVTIHGSNDPNDLDNYHLMFQLAAERLDLAMQVKAMNEEAALIWSSFESPIPWVVPEAVWTEKTDALSSKLYYANKAAFLLSGRADDESSAIQIRITARNQP
jgi:hypothetical protein